MKGFGLGAIFAITCALHAALLIAAVWWQPVLWHDAVAWLRRWRAVVPE